MDGVLVAPLEGLLPVHDAREPIRAVIASLAPGGAERIVLEWLGAEAARGRDVELAVLHARDPALAPPPRVRVRVRDAVTPAAFVDTTGAAWGGHGGCVSTHLVPDDLLQRLWARGLRTVPVVHNSPEGWRNDPRRWNAADVPVAVACAAHVRDAMLAAGCAVPVRVIRHAPTVGRAAFDPAVRAAVRAELGIAPGTFLVGAIGAFKPQKDYARAVEVLARLARQRDAALCIVGGVLNAAGLAQLDAMMVRALQLDVAGRVRLPGFATRIEPWLAAFDALLNVSRFEGLSMATREALAAGLPVVAAHVGGQAEIAHAALQLLAADAGAEDFSRALSRYPVRAALTRVPQPRAPREWSVALHARRPAAARIDTLFVTANLNAGGAQRSLVNLAARIASRHAFALAVCGESTHGAFASELRTAGVHLFRPAPDADAFALAESILAHADAGGARSLCLWNVDARVKLLLAKFAGRALRLVDVSPGAYAFEELAACAGFAASIGTCIADYERRLDTLVLKYAAAPAGP